MKKVLIILLSVISVNLMAQSNLKYSGFFDSYYKSGPAKYFVEPGITIMKGELDNSNLGFGIGAGINYRILPAVYINGSLRYSSMVSKDHEPSRNMSYSGSAIQLNAIGNYHFVYDLVRKKSDVRRGAKMFNAYISTGVALMLNYSVETSFAGSDDFGTSYNSYKTNITKIVGNDMGKIIQIPVGLGLPIRVTPRFTMTPEVMWYFGISDEIDGLNYASTSKNDSYLFLNIKFMFNPKGKRLHPKQPHASNSEGNGSAGNNDSFDENSNSDDDFEMNNFDSDDSNNEENVNEEEIIEETEEVIEEEDEIIDEEIIEDEESFDDEENSDKKEDQYDEDGFLIDE